MYKDIHSSWKKKLKWPVNEIFLNINIFICQIGNDLKMLKYFIVKWAFSFLPDGRTDQLLPLKNNFLIEQSIVQSLWYLHALTQLFYFGSLSERNKNSPNDKNKMIKLWYVHMVEYSVVIRNVFLIIWDKCLVYNE